MLEELAADLAGERYVQRVSRSGADGAQQSDELLGGDSGSGGGIRQLGLSGKEVDRCDRPVGDQQGWHRRICIHDNDS